MRFSLRFLLKNKVLNYPLFRRYLLMRVALVFALNMQLTVISYMVYQLTRDELSLGLIGLAEVIPAIGCSFFSGYFVDQYEKRNLLAGCITGYVLLASFFVLLSLPAIQDLLGISATMLLIYSGVFAGGVLRAFLSPSAFALIGMLVPRRLYPNATTWSGLAWQTGAVVGPLTGGVMIAAGGFSFSLGTVLVIELIALTAIFCIPKQPVWKKAKEPILKSLGQGMRFVFRTEIILAVLALDMFAVLFGGAEALLPVFADDILAVGEVGFGWLRAAPGIGSILTLFALSFIPIRTKAGIKMLACVAGFGLTMIVFGLSDFFLLSFVMLLAGGMFDAVSVVIRGTILQLHTPDVMRGRVAAVNTMFVSSSNELGALESGIAARLMGTVPAVLFGGVMTLLIAGITYVRAPVLRSLRLEPAHKSNT